MADLKTSPLAPPDGFPDLPEIAGVQYSATCSGTKYVGRNDTMLAVMLPGTSVAGVFTRSKTRSDSVMDCQAKVGMESPAGAAFLVNAGNANAFTGSFGKASVEALVEAVSATTEVPRNRVFTASTGVIGEPLNHEMIAEKLGAASESLSLGNAEAAARAILTTDTFPKGSAAEFDFEGGTVHIAGFAKGSGMIQPDMATMLAYVFTDAKVSQPVLQAMLGDAVDETFNCITVDSDTSTSDTLLIAATGQSDCPEVDGSGSLIGSKFYAALKSVLLDLAHQVVRDGEGATKFIEVSVTGAKTHDDGVAVARSIANSPLVKTAVAGEDPNWGRVVMAVGKSGADADRDLLSIWFGDILVAKGGWVHPDYSEDAGAAYMKNQDLKVTVDLGLGSSDATVWTCDLTHGYIEINADYRS